MYGSSWSLCWKLKCCFCTWKCCIWRYCMDLLIPAFHIEVLHMQHHSWVFLMPAFKDLPDLWFMDFPDSCINGSSRSLCSWISLKPAFMDLPETCIHGSSWSRNQLIFMILEPTSRCMDLLDPSTNESSWSLNLWLFLIQEHTKKYGSSWC